MELRPKNRPARTPSVKANLQLGAESFSLQAGVGGNLSGQLAAVRAETMTILNDFITKNNAPNDIPDEPVEGNSDEDEMESVVNPPKKSKKQG